MRWRKNRWPTARLERNEETAAITKGRLSLQAAQATQSSPKGQYDCHNRGGVSCHVI